MSILNLGVSQRRPAISRSNPLQFQFQNQLFPGYEEFANVPFPSYENFIGSYSQVDPSAPMYDEAGIRSLAIADTPTTGLFPQRPLNRLSGLNLSRFQGVSDLGRDDEDVEQVSSLTEPTGLAKLAQFLPFGDKSLLRAGLNIVKDLIPRSDPRAISMRNFYGNRFGLTNIGQVASGPMKGYNPVSGGLFGKEKTFGLGKAISDRIKVRTDPKTLARVAKFSDARKAKFFETTKQLQDLAKDERGSKSLDKAFDRDRTREKDLRGGSGKDFGPYS